tara:strand:- start:271 stop:648 length:378 start_codon:yes stop_codon:yes gene_type:complete
LATQSDLPISVPVPGGLALVGADRPHFVSNAESPVRQKRLPDCRMTEIGITNAQFSAFVSATRYLTDAESYGWFFVFWDQLTEGACLTAGVVGAEWLPLANGDRMGTYSTQRAWGCSVSMGRQLA